MIEDFIDNNKIVNGIFKFTDNRCNSKKYLAGDILIPRHPGIMRETYVKLGYVFDPIFNSVGPDLDLLIYGLTSGTFHDLRSVKFHHSIGNILDSNFNLICGCNSSLINSNPQKTKSQKRMHSENVEDIIKLVVNKWGKLNLFLARLACNTKFSKFLVTSIRPNKKNSTFRLIFLCMTKFYLSKFMRPRCRDN
jgi:hypothetical protein